jgi:cytochrome c553
MRVCTRSLMAAWMVALGCQSRAEDLREWKPSDHHNTSNTAAKRKGQTTANSESRVAGLDEVTLNTWANQCTPCHGRIGAGNGPQAPMFKPPDLTDAEWQDSVTDERLFTSIQQGRNKMPAFNLPEGTARSLVKLVRMVRRSPPQAPSPSANASPQAAATASAPQPSSSGSVSAPAGAAGTAR